MSNIPTAEEFSLEHLGDQYVTQNIENMLIAFAKLHVQQFAKELEERGLTVKNVEEYLELHVK